MKKIFAALLVGLMALSVTACSNNNGSTQINSQPQQSAAVQESKVVELAEIAKTDNTKDDYLTDTKLYSCFYKKISGDNVNMSISGKAETNGVSMTVDMQVQKQGENAYMNMNMLGMNIKAIKKDGYTYGINDSSKKYSKTKTETETSNGTDKISDITNNVNSIVGELKDIEFVKNGLSEEDGATDYEEYKSNGSSGK